MSTQSAKKKRIGSRRWVANQNKTSEADEFHVTDGVSVAQHCLPEENTESLNVLANPDNSQSELQTPPSPELTGNRRKLGSSRRNKRGQRVTNSATESCHKPREEVEENTRGNETSIQYQRQEELSQGSEHDITFATDGDPLHSAITPENDTDCKVVPDSSKLMESMLGGSDKSDTLQSEENAHLVGNSEFSSLSVFSCPTVDQQRIDQSNSRDMPGDDLPNVYSATQKESKERNEDTELLRQDGKLQGKDFVTESHVESVVISFSTTPHTTTDNSSPGEHTELANSVEQAIVPSPKEELPEDEEQNESFILSEVIVSYHSEDTVNKVHEQELNPTREISESETLDATENSESNSGNLIDQSVCELIVKSTDDSATKHEDLNPDGKQDEHPTKENNFEALDQTNEDYHVDIKPSAEQTLHQQNEGLFSEMEESESSLQSLQSEMNAPLDSQPQQDDTGSSESERHDAIENPESISGNLIDKSEDSDTYQCELIVKSTDDSAAEQEDLNPDDKQDEHPTKENNFEALDQTSEDYHVYDTKNLKISGLERVDTAPDQVYEGEGQVEDDIKPSIGQTGDRENDGLFSEMKESESSLQSLQSEMNTPLDSQPQQDDTGFNPIGNRRKLGSSRRNKGRQQAKDSVAESNRRHPEEVVGNIRDSEPIETTKMSLTMETAVQEKSMEILLEEVDTFDSAQTEVSDQVKENEHVGTLVGISEVTASNITADQQLTDQSASTEMTEEELPNVYSVTEKEIKERDKDNKLLMQDGNVQDNYLVSESHVKSEDIESSITPEISTEKHSPGEHTQPENSVEQRIVSSPKEELPEDEEQNESFILSEVKDVHHSDDATNTVHEQELNPTHESTDDSVTKHEDLNPDDKQDDIPTKENNFEALDQTSEDYHVYDTKNLKISGLERVDTAPGQVYEGEGQVEDDIKPSTEQTGDRENDGLFSEMEESESSLQSLQSEMNTPLDSQPQQDDTGFNPIGSRRKLGSSRRNKGRQQAKDSVTESNRRHPEEVVGNIRDSEPLETTKMSLTMETAVLEKSMEILLEEVDTFDSAQTEVSDQVKENEHVGTLVGISEDTASSLTVDQQLIDQSASTEMTEELPNVYLLTEKEIKGRDDNTKLLMQDGNVQDNYLVSESHVKSEDIESSITPEISTEKHSPGEHTQPENSVEQRIVSSPKEELPEDEEQNESFILSEVKDVHHSDDATSEVHEQELNPTHESTDDSVTKHEDLNPDDKQDEHPTKENNFEALDQTNEDYHVDIKPSAEQTLHQQNEGLFSEMEESESSLQSLQSEMNAPLDSQPQQDDTGSSESERHDAIENPESISGNLIDQSEDSDTYQCELIVKSTDDSAAEQEDLNPDDKQDEHPTKENNFEALDQTSEDYHVYDTKKLQMSGIERVDTAPDQVYEGEGQVEDDIKPSAEQTGDRENEGLFSEMKESESSLQSLQSEMNTPLDSQPQQDDTGFNPIGNRRKLGSSRRNKGRQQAKDSVAESNRRHPEEVVGNIRDNEPLETTKMSLTMETAVQEKPMETLLEEMDTFDSAQTEVSDQVKENEHVGTLVGIPEDTTSNITADQQLTDQSASTEMTEEELPNVYSVTEKEIKERDKDNKLLMQDGNVQDNYLVSESHVKSEDIESSITPEISTEKHSPGEHTQPENSVEQTIVSSPKEELPEDEKQNESFILSEVKDVHHSDDATNTVHEQELNPTHEIDHSSESETHATESFDDSATKQEDLNPDDKQDDIPTKENNSEALDQTSEDYHVYDTRNLKISDIERVDTAPDQVYEGEGQVEDDIKPSAEQTGDRENEGLFSEMEESESSLQSLQSEMNTPLDSQPQQDDTGFNPIGNRRKLGSSRRNKGRQQAKDSVAESNRRHPEEVVGNIRDNEPLETTKMSLTMETAVQEKSMETLLEEVDTFDSAQTEVSDQVKEHEHVGTFVGISEVTASNITADQQLTDQSASTEMTEEELPNVYLLTEKEIKERDKDNKLLWQDGNVQDNVLVSESHVKSEDIESSIIPEISTEKHSPGEHTQPENSVEQRIVSSPKEELPEDEEQNESFILSEVKDVHHSDDATSEVHEQELNPTHESTDDSVTKDEDLNPDDKQDEHPTKENNFEALDQTNEDYHVDIKPSAEQTLHQQNEGLFSEMEESESSLQSLQSELNAPLDSQPQQDDTGSSESERHDATENPESISGNLIDKSEDSDTYPCELIVKSTDDSAAEQEDLNPDDKQDEHPTKENNFEALDQTSEDYHVYDTKNLKISGLERVDTAPDQVYEGEGQVEDDIKPSTGQTGDRENEGLFSEMEESESSLQSLQSEMNTPLDSQPQQDDTGFNPIGNRRKLGSSRRNKGRQQAKDSVAEPNHRHPEEVVGNIRDNEPLETTKMSLTMETAVQEKSMETLLEEVDTFDSAQTEVSDQVKEHEHVGTFVGISEVTASSLTVDQQLIDQSDLTAMTEEELPNVYSVTEKEIKERDDNTELLWQDGNVQDNYLVSESHVKSEDIESSIIPGIPTEKHSPGEHTQPENSVEQTIVSSPKEELPEDEKQNESFILSEVKDVHHSDDATNTVHEQELNPTHEIDHSSESETHATESFDDSATKQEDLNPDDKQDDIPTKENNFEALDQTSEDNHVYDTKNLKISDIERVDTAPDQVYEGEGQVEDDIKPSTGQTGDRENEGLFSEMEESESSLQSLQSEMNTPLDSQPQQDDTGFNPIGNRRKLGSSRRNKGRQHAKDSVAEPNCRHPEEVVGNIRDNEPLETTKMSLTMETAVQEKSMETLLEEVDTFDSAQTEVSDQVKEHEHVGTFVGISEVTASNITADQQLTDQSASTEMTEEELPNVYSVTEKEIKERDKDNKLLMQDGNVQDNYLVSESHVKSEDIESSITPEISTEKHSPGEHTQPENSVEQTIVSSPKEELPEDEKQNESFILSEVKDVHHSDDATNTVHEQELNPTHEIDHSSESETHATESFDDSATKQEDLNPDDKQDDIPTKENNSEALDQTSEDYHVYDTRNLKISDIERVDTAPDQVYEGEGQVEDDIKPSAEQTGDRENEGLFSEMEESESSLQSLQSEMNTPLDSQPQQDDTGFNPIGNRRKLGSSRRNKGRQHAKDSVAESNRRHPEEVVGNIRDNEPLETTKMSLTMETAVLEKSMETLLEEVDTFDSAQTEVNDQVEENEHVGTLVGISEVTASSLHSNLTADQQLIDQSASTEMTEEELPNVYSDQPENSVEQAIVSSPKEELSSEEEQKEHVNLSEVTGYLHSEDVVNEVHEEVAETTQMQERHQIDFSSVKKSESSLQSLQSEMDPSDSQLLDNSVRIDKHTRKNRRKLGSSRRNKGRQHVTDSKTYHKPEEEFVENTRGDDKMPEDDTVLSQNVMDNDTIVTTEITSSSGKDDSVKYKDVNEEGKNLIKEPENLSLFTGYDTVKVDSMQSPEDDSDIYISYHDDSVTTSSITLNVLEQEDAYQVQKTEALSCDKDSLAQTSDAIDTVEGVTIKDNSTELESLLDVQIFGQDEVGETFEDPTKKDHEAQEMSASEEITHAELFSAAHNKTDPFDSGLQCKPAVDVPEESGISSIRQQGIQEETHSDNSEDLQGKSKQKRRKMGSTRRTQLNRKPEEGMDNKDNTQENKMKNVDKLEVVEEFIVAAEVSLNENANPSLNPVYDKQQETNETSTAHNEEVVHTVKFVHAADIRDSERNVDVDVEPSQLDDDDATKTLESFVPLCETAQSTQNDEERPESANIIQDQATLKSAEAPVVTVADLEMGKSVVGGEAGEENKDAQASIEELNNMNDGAHNKNLEMENASPSLNSASRRRKMGSTRRNLGSRNKREDLHQKQEVDNEAAGATTSVGDVKTESFPGFKEKVELQLHVQGDSEQRREKVFETVEYSHTGETQFNPPSHQTFEENPVSRGQLEDTDHHLSLSYFPAIPSTSPKHDVLSETVGGRRRKMGSHRKSRGPQNNENQTARGDKITDTQDERDVTSVIDESAIKATEEESLGLDKITEVDESDKKPSSNISNSKAAEPSRPVSEKTPARATPVHNPFAGIRLGQESQQTFSLADGSRSNSYNVMMVGDSSVGKTSFMKRAQSGKFSLDLPASIGLDSCTWTVVVDGKPMVLQLWDTAGQERFRSITRQIFHKAQAFLLMYDITSSQSFSAVSYWANCIQEEAAEDVAILLLGNKSDHTKRQVKSQDGESLAKEYNFEFMECSAATGENVIHSLETVARMLSQKTVTREETTVLHKEPQQKKSSGCC